MLYAGKTAPSGWLLCDGSAVSRTTYSALYDAIGTTYGSGDGSTTFNLPNMSGRVPVGVSSSYKLGATGGEAAHTLTVGEIANHSHGIIGASSSGNDYAGSIDYAVSYADTRRGWWLRSVISNGSGEPHNNMQPYLVMNYVIKVS